MGSLLEKTEEPAERAGLIQHLLEQFKSTLIRQTVFAEFERMAHRWVEKGGTLTAWLLCDMYRKLNEEYFGPDMSSDPEIAWEWAGSLVFTGPSMYISMPRAFPRPWLSLKNFRRGMRRQPGIAGNFSAQEAAPPWSF